MTPINLYDCTPDCDMTKVINTRRATWICAKCKRDVSLQYLLWYQAAHPEEWPQLRAAIDDMVAKCRS